MGKSCSISAYTETCASDSMTNHVVVDTGAEAVPAAGARTEDLQWVRNSSQS